MKYFLGRNKAFMIADSGQRVAITFEEYEKATGEKVNEELYSKLREEPTAPEGQEEVLSYGAPKEEEGVSEEEERPED